ncbi:MAG: demethoxyubiquinone hydroxylase family protein [Parvularcula sp.]
MAKTPQSPGAMDRRLAEMLRVDHAGEFGAVAIYRGQHAVFSASPKTERTAEIIKEMEEGEHVHLETFSTYLRERKVRPTLLAPFWNVAGFALGAGTALMGEKAAMACTTAVETVIGDHYAEQLDELPPEEEALAQTIDQFREEELEHHDTAMAEGAEEAPFYGILKAVIGTGCKAAIAIAQKI